MTDPRDNQALAAEYVLGLLEAEASVEAERRLASDAGFARDVAAWRTRFAELDDTADSVTPGNELWRRIEQETTTARPSGARSAASAGLLAGLWGSLAAWRIVATGSAVTAVAFAVLAAISLQHAQQAADLKPVYVAILVDDATRQPGALVNAFADGRVEMIPLVDMGVPSGRALQVWTLWNREVGPRPVSLMSRAHATALDFTKLPATGADQLFEITLEPAGGSPTGRPTGPILYKGTTARTL
jgi:anti-sigma-K factor RskA